MAGHGMPYKLKPALRDLKRLREAETNINAALRMKHDAEERLQQMQQAEYDLVAELLGTGSFVISSVSCVKGTRCIYVGAPFRRQCWVCGSHEDELY